MTIDSKVKDNLLQRQVIATLLYFDIFRYPLTVEEIYKFLSISKVSRQDLQNTLQQLVDLTIVYRIQNLYAVNHDESIFNRRLKGNIAAENAMPSAIKWASFISKFPFVRGVMISGSLSKGYMDEKSDLDFFIVTSHNRLWIARTLLVLYKRIFLFNSHQFFCVNYFVDEKYPMIEEHNLFTSTELSTLIPLYDEESYLTLLQHNQWLLDYLPNFEPRPIPGAAIQKSTALKKSLEFGMNLLLPNVLNNFFRNITLGRWRRIYERDYNRDDFDLVFKSKPYASKNHPQNFQKQVLDKHAEKLRMFQHKLSDIGAHSSVKSSL